MRPLNSDQLGAKGEAKFDELCHDAKLIPNKNSRDRAGWDYVVEWPTEDGSTYSRDRLPAPLATLVQVKSVWDSTQNIKMRLSSIERLVKDPRPSYVVIQRFSQSLQLVGLNIVHVRGNFSANILKRLRQSHADKIPANHIQFTFGISKWSETVSPSGNGFRQFVESEITEGLSDYGLNKTKELNKLGFDESALSNVVTFKLQNEEELFDLFLGLRKLGGRVSSATETRFGIPLPLVDMPDADGIISVQPEPSCKCDIIFRRSLSATPLKFEADMFFPPATLNSSKFFKALIKADLFQLIVKADLKLEPVKLDLSFTADQNALKTYSLSLNKIRDFHQLICEMSKQALSLELIPDNSGPALLNGSISASPSDEFTRYAKYIVELCDIVVAALLKAGVSNRAFTLSALAEAGDEIFLLGSCMEDPSGLMPFSFVTTSKAGVVDGAEFDTLYASHISIGELTLAYCLKANMLVQIDGKKLRCRSTSMEFLSIQTIAKTQQGMDNFVDWVEKQTGIQSHFAMKIID